MGGARCSTGGVFLTVGQGPRTWLGARSFCSTPPSCNTGRCEKVLAPAARFTGWCRLWGVSPNYGDLLTGDGCLLVPPTRLLESRSKGLRVTLQESLLLSPNTLTLSSEQTEPDPEWLTPSMLCDSTPPSPCKNAPILQSILM